MSFFEKYAKLRSELQESYDTFKVLVYDDKIERIDGLIMILDGQVISQGDTPQSIYVNLINFDDTNFSQLSKNQQDMAGVILLKKFMSYYKEKWGKDSEHWLPIDADFRNYRLQEMVEKGINEGVFHPDSLKYSKLTTKEDWDTNQVFNIDNRKTLKELLDTPEKFYPELTFDNMFVVNTPMSQVFNSYRNAVEKYPVLLKNNDIEHSTTYPVGYIDASGLYIAAPFAGY